MSLNINGERLLSEALSDAMEQDLSDVPAREQLEKQHRFSKKFVRRMKRIENGKEPVRDFAELGRQARRFGGLAAAFVCVVGFAALLGVMGRMGASKGGSAAIPADESLMESSEEMGVESEDNDSTGLDAPAGAAADDTADFGESEDFEESADFAGEPAAPGWQERLLSESEKADALISWHLSDVYDGMSFVLESELVEGDALRADNAPALTVSVSLICEVYYKERADEWVRVYRTDRAMSRCKPRVIWGDEYFMSELNMTRPGTYRVVRQVNSYRQVLELTLEKMGTSGVD